jgi:hypothetical protein
VWVGLILGEPIAAAPKSLPNPDLTHPGGSQQGMAKGSRVGGGGMQRADIKRYGAHAQRAIPRFEKAIHYFEHEETEFPKAGSLKKAEAVRQTIAEI